MQLCILIHRKMHYICTQTKKIHTHTHTSHTLLPNAWMNDWMNEESSSGVGCRYCSWNAFDKFVASLAWYSSSAWIYFLLRWLVSPLYAGRMARFPTINQLMQFAQRFSIRLHIYLTWILYGCVCVCAYAKISATIVPLADANDSSKMDFVCTAKGTALHS